MNRASIIALTALAALGIAPSHMLAQQRGRGPADHPAVTVKGETYTPASILARNMGTTDDQETQFPPHKIVGNVYYVGAVDGQLCFLRG